MNFWMTFWKLSLSKSSHLSIWRLKVKKLAIAIVLGLNVPASVNAQSSFSDNQFNLAFWSAHLLGGGNVGSVTLQTIAGLSGNGLRTRIVPAIPGQQMTWDIFCKKSDWYWDPAAMGRFSAVSWELWVRVSGPSSYQGLRVGFAQGDSYYIGQARWEPPIFSPNWQRASATEPTPAFTKVSGSGPSTLLFSETAPRIYAGYMVSFGGVGITSTVNCDNSLFTLGVTPEPAGISGVVDRMGWSGSGPVVARLEIYQGGVLVETQAAVPVASDGAFTTTTSRKGPCQIRVQTEHCLAKRLTGLVLPYSTVGLAVQQYLGDINGDNSIDIADYSILSAQYGGSGSGDLNGDGSVDIADYSILSQNYGLNGEN